MENVPFFILTENFSIMTGKKRNVYSFSTEICLNTGPLNVRINAEKEKNDEKKGIRKDLR